METATAERPAIESATGSKTLADLFPLAVRKHGPKKAIVFKDDSGQTNALSFAGTYKVVFLAFPLESYGSATQKSALVTRVMTFFGP